MIESNCVRNDVFISDNTLGGSTIGNLNNNINTKTQQIYSGGQFDNASVVSNLIVQQGAVIRLQNRQVKTYSGVVAETATVSAANVTINNTRYNAIVQVKLVGRSTLGLPHGGGIGTFLVSRVDGGATVIELSRTSSASGVILESCSTSGNTVSIRVSGTDNGTSTNYNYVAEVSVIVDNFAAITLS